MTAAAEVLLRKLTPYQGKKVLIKRWQQTGDIITQIEAAHKANAADYDRISDGFRRGSVKATCEAVYDFAKANIRYVCEPDAVQTTASPAAILAQGKGDCKHMSSFICGVLASLKRKGMQGFTVMYRFASYYVDEKRPGHVFAVCKTDGGTEYWIDPVPPLEYFNERTKVPTYKTDLAAMNGLYHISGISEDGFGKFRFRPGKFFAKVGLAPSRNAFLLLVKLNVMGLATKISQSIAKGGEGKWRAFWEKAGGNFNALMKEVRRAEKRKARRAGVQTMSGMDLMPVMEGEAAVGALPFAAAIAAATPLILLATKIFKGDGVDTSDVADATGQSASAVSGFAQDCGFGYICGIALNGTKRAARKAKRAAKKTARKAKRATNKAARQAKRAARRARKAAGKETAADAVNDFADNTKVAVTADAAGNETLHIQSGKGSQDSPYELPGATVRSGGGGGDDYSGAGADGAAASAEGDGSNEPEKEPGGFGLDNKMLMLAAGAAGLWLLTKKK